MSGIDALPVYVAYQASPFNTFKTLSMENAQKLTNQGHKVYIYTTHDPAQLTTVTLASLGATSSTTFNLGNTTNNVYWNGQMANGQNRATVGSDIDVPASGPTSGLMTFWQYIDVNHAGSPSNSNKAKCNQTNPAPYPPSIDSGGELRHSSYWIALIAGSNKCFLFTGVMMCWNGSQIVAAIFLVSTQTGQVGTQGNVCSIPVLNTPGIAYGWGLKTPPPFNTIASNWAVLPTISANASKAQSTNALVFNQVFSQGVVPPPQGVTVNFTSTAPVNFLTIQGGIVTDQNGNPITEAPGTFFECQQPGCTQTGGSGYHNFTTDASGKFSYQNHLPPQNGAHLYRDWVTVTVAGQKYSSKICEINTDASGGGTAVCGL